jgi:hypothetical protein
VHAEQQKIRGRGVMGIVEAPVADQRLQVDASSRPSRFGD